MDYIKDFLLEIVYILNEMSPYLLLGFLFAGILKVFLPQKFIDKHLGKASFKSVLYASLLGVPMPLCSCGVIPTGISIHKNGASKGAAVSFLISTPQTGVDSILVTYSLLGLPFAIVRPIVALITGIFGGIATNISEKSNINNNNSEKINNDTESTVNTTSYCTNTNNSTCTTKTTEVGIETTCNSEDNNCTNGTCPVPNKNKSKLYNMLKYAFVDFLQDIAKWLVIGILIAAVISVLIPDNFFDQFIGNKLLEMGIILLVAIPLYVCATGSIPIVAALILKGLSPGAALVFLMAGPATNAATITVLRKTIGKRAMWSYLISIVLGAFIFGSIINLLPSEWFTNTVEALHCTEGGHLPIWLSWSSSIILSLLIINAFYQKKRKNKKMNTTNRTNEITVTVNGMNCNHCKNSVEKHISALDGIKSAIVNLDKKTLTIEGENVDLEKVKAEINSLGYEYKG